MGAVCVRWIVEGRPCSRRVSDRMMGAGNSMLASRPPHAQLPQAAARPQQQAPPQQPSPPQQVSPPQMAHAAAQAAAQAAYAQRAAAAAAAAQSAQPRPSTLAGPSLASTLGVSTSGASIVGPGVGAGRGPGTGDIWSHLQAAHMTIQQQMQQQFVASVERAAAEEQHRIETAYKHAMAELEQRMQNATAAYKQVHAGLTAEMQKAKERRQAQLGEVHAKSGAFLAGRSAALPAPIPAQPPSMVPLVQASQPPPQANSWGAVAAEAVRLPSALYQRSPTFEHWCERALHMHPKTVVATTIEVLCRALAANAKRPPLDVIGSLTPEFCARHRSSLALLAQQQQQPDVPHGMQAHQQTTTTTLSTSTTTTNAQPAPAPPAAPGRAWPQAAPGISAFFGAQFSEPAKPQPEVAAAPLAVESLDSKETADLGDFTTGEQEPALTSAGDGGYADTDTDVSKSAYGGTDSMPQFRRPARLRRPRV
jgi:hypothetical protein